MDKLTKERRAEIVRQNAELLEAKLYSREYYRLIYEAHFKKEMKKGELRWHAREKALNFVIKVYRYSSPNRSRPVLKSLDKFKQFLGI